MQREERKQQNQHYITRAKKKSTSRNDAVSRNGINCICAFRKPPFNPRPSFRVSFTRSVANSFLESSILPLLSISHNPSFTIRRHRPVTTVRYLRHGVSVRNNSNLHRRRRNLINHNNKKSVRYILNNISMSI